MKYNIEPYFDLELDCLQNLYVSLLNFNNLEVRYLGAVWPWTFQYNIEKKKNSNIQVSYKIENDMCVTQKSLKELYDVELVYCRPLNADQMWGEVKKLLKQGIEVIAGIDQYHIPWHYPYIYHKKHGWHFIMVLDYDVCIDQLLCIDTIPLFKGIISASEFKDGIFNNEKLWYSILRFPQSTKSLNYAEAWCHFRDKIISTQTSYENIPESNDEIVYTPFFISRLQKALNTRNNQILLQELNAICQGTWGWEVNRKGKWLIAFLQMQHKEGRCKNFEKLTELIEENDKNWSLVFRFLFRESKRIPVNGIVLDIIELFNKIQKCEKYILELLDFNR